MKLSQERQIYNFLRSGESLTRREADDMFDCCKLPARISGINKDQKRGLYPNDFLIAPKIFTSRTGKRLARYKMAICTNGIWEYCNREN